MSILRHNVENNVGLNVKISGIYSNAENWSFEMSFNHQRRLHLKKRFRLDSERHKVVDG